MDVLGKALSFIFDLLIFAIVTILFVPSFFIVTYLQEFWSKKLSDLFGF
jgi:uncharacterized phage infection (PIP) family protein YhgE